MKSTIMWALILIGFCLFFGYAYATLWAVFFAVVCFIYTIRHIMSLIRKKSGYITRHHLITAVVVWSLIIAFMSAFKYDQRIAKTRANYVIACCEQYKSKYGKYPDKLEDLVPEFIEKIPRVNYELGYNNFIYRTTSKGEHMLWYVEVPPFGRPTYLLEAKRWTSID